MSSSFSCANKPKPLNCLPFILCMIIIVAIKLTGNEMILNPPDYTVIEPNSVLSTLGEILAIEKREKIAGGSKQ